VDAVQPRLVGRYPGRLTVRRVADGSLELSVRLPFDRYLEGIAEVPPSWPREALEAQAIAARSYALATTGWSGAEGEALDTPICSTTACQVYRGIPPESRRHARPWYRAVRATDGQVLLHAGRPAETVYFSTSDGHTYGNDVVFGSAPLPYLRGVPERDDGASPTSHWRSTIPLRDLATFLSAAGEWPARRPVDGVRGDGDRVTISGGGRSQALAGSTFRAAVNTWAPCLRPGRYPPGALPVTIPSRWTTIETIGGNAVADGRGWGHGAGMVQWGAYGKARRGWSAERILGYYYGGLRPEAFPEPGLIHVEIAGGLTSLRIVPSDPGASLAGETLGTEPVLVVGGEALTVRGMDPAS
jgi:stage II sporulation protein D